ncbi:hypothetical protein QE381_003061 [Microbacterium sp. SORGH_AS 888]|nr:hypothetical protein [Microbacterium sp. SORGH_AS_0888]
MFRLLINLVATVVVTGLAVALLITFNWDIGATIKWTWGRTVWLIGMVADWFISMPWFQESVSS